MERMCGEGEGVVIEVVGSLPINPTPSRRRNGPQGRKIHDVELLMVIPRR